MISVSTTRTEQVVQHSRKSKRIPWSFRRNSTSKTPDVIVTVQPSAGHLSTSPSGQASTISTQDSVGEPSQSDLSDREEVMSLQTSPTSISLEQDGLPTYSQAAYPSEPTTYKFTQSSPFAMTLTNAREPQRCIYHISVGVNVWMPSSQITFVRKGGSGEGHIVAQLEMGISSGMATVSVGNRHQYLKHVMTRRSGLSKSRYYHIGDGNVIEWKVKSSIWNAYLGPALLGTFDPQPPTRTLILQPAAHTVFDHIVVGLLILMREHLTPTSALVGDSAQLFNYHPSRGMSLEGGAVEKIVVTEASDRGRCDTIYRKAKSPTSWEPIFRDANDGSSWTSCHWSIGRGCVPGEFTRWGRV